jgi:hypothetical protein
MTTYTWTVTAMDCYPEVDGEADVVFTVHWTCAGVDGEYSSSVYSTQAVTVDSAEPFTPYDQLTQDQVLNWVWTSGVDKDVTEAAVDQQIQNLINPPVVTPPLPWVTLEAPIAE